MAQYLSLIIFILLLPVAWYLYRQNKSGGGKAGAFSSGSVLAKYARDLTKLAVLGKLDPVIGREHEISRVVEILSRRTKNNPVLAGSDSIALAEKIISHPLVGDVRYNTGGSSPYSPRKITEILASMAKAYRKELYIDLEGRQVRVAKWSLQSRGSVVLNHDFELELPGIINFRGCGWFKIIGAKPEQRKIYIEPKRSKAENFFGESQSVNVVAKKFIVKGNLSRSDLAFMKAACRYGVDHFMLSFVESRQDIVNFYRQHLKLARTFSEMIPKPELILKIESRKGIELVRSWSADEYPECRLMAARDDLFLSMVNEREKYLGALQLIIEKDPQAIVASRLMSGLLEANEEMTSGDMADLALMSLFGYKHFMLSDSMSRCFDIAMEDWQKIVLPLLRQAKT